MKLTREEMLRTFQETTWRKGIDQCLKNFEENLPYVERTVRDLRWEVAAPSSALVVGIGPSLHRRGTAERLRRNVEGRSPVRLSPRVIAVGMARAASSLRSARSCRRSPSRRGAIPP